MTEVFRVSGYHQGRINAAADEVWNLVTDWGSLAWFNDENNQEGMKLMESWLEGDPDQVPRTRVMARDEAAAEKGAPTENREVLLVADREAHRLYYDATDGFAPGIRNYLASWSFDELPDGACMMTITSNFDCVPASTGEQNRDMLQQVYVAIVDSLDRYFTRRR